MRDLQIAYVHYRIAIQQNIDVDGSRAVRDDSSTPQSPLHAFNCMQQLQREQPCFRFRHQIQKLRLRAKILRLGFIHARDAKDRNPSLRQEFQCLVEMLAAISNVRPE